MFKPVEPYKLWSIDKTDFPTKGKSKEKIAFLLNYAILAPSAFNVQPWKFSIEDNKVTIFPDFSRTLSTSDKNNRLLYMSMGCVLKNLELASSAFGFQTKSQILKQGNDSSIEVLFESSGNKKNLNPLDLITNRLTNRSKYLPKKVPKGFIDEINKFKNSDEIDLVISNDNVTREKITNLTIKADMIIWNDPEFKSQHLKWVRNNISKKHDGMPAFTVGIPLLASFFAKPVIKNKNFAKFQAKKNKNLLESTPYFAFILSKNHNQESWIRVGKIFEEISLLATKYGLAVAPLAEVVEVGEIYKETMKVLKTNLRPQLFFRLGYPSKKAEHSPRRRVINMLAI